MLEMNNLKEREDQLTVNDLAQAIFWEFKQNDKRKSPYEGLGHCTSPYEFSHKYFKSSHILTEDRVPLVLDKAKMRVADAFALLERRGLIMRFRLTSNKDSSSFVLTSVGYESRFDEDESILILDDAEKRIQSIRNEVPNLDSMVADYYRESIRAWQEGLLLSACICLGAASEAAVYRLADAVVIYDKNYESRIKSWKNRRKDMRHKIGTLWSFVNEIHEADFQNEACFKDFCTKIRAFADWIRITRNEASHPDREVEIPESREVELSICQFGRFVVSIFRIIGLFESSPK